MPCIFLGKNVLYTRTVFHEFLLNIYRAHPPSNISWGKGEGGAPLMRNGGGGAPWIPPSLPGPEGKKGKPKFMLNSSRNPRQFKGLAPSLPTNGVPQ